MELSYKEEFRSQDGGRCLPSAPSAPIKESGEKLLLF